MLRASGGTAPVGMFAFGSADGGVVDGGAAVSVGGCGAGGVESEGAVVDVGGAESGGGVCMPCAHAGKAAPARSMAGSINRVFITISLPQAPCFRRVRHLGGRFVPRMR